MNSFRLNFRFCLSLFFSVTAIISSRAAVTPLPVTGWNQDMILNNGFDSYDQSITGTVDNGGGNAEGGTFAAPGMYPVQIYPDYAEYRYVSGIVSGIPYLSAAGTGTSFVFQDADALNSLLLTSGISGTLALDSPATMTTLALIGTSGHGPTRASVTFHFSDSTTSTYNIAPGTGIAADWFAGLPAALNVGHRESNHHEDGYTSIYSTDNPLIAIYESDIYLSASDRQKTVQTITITNTGTSGNLALMAVSADAVFVPETSSSIMALIGAAYLLRRHRNSFSALGR